MAKGESLNKEKLLSSLPVDSGSVTKADEFIMDQMSLARSVLKLADINQEREYLLCSAVAKKLLEKVPEPESVEIDID